MLFDVNLGRDEEEGEADAVEQHANDECNGLVCSEKAITQKRCGNRDQEKISETESAQHRSQKVHRSGLCDLSESHDSAGSVEANVLQLKRDKGVERGDWNGEESCCDEHCAVAWNTQQAKGFQSEKIFEARTFFR